MRKEEILEKSREDYKNRDVYESEVGKKAMILAQMFGILLSSILYALLIFIKNEVHIEIFMILSGMESVLFTYKHIKLRKKHELIVSILYTITFILCLMVFLRSFFA